MAIPIFTSDFTVISACESVTNWTTNSALLDAEIKKEGDYAIGGTCTGAKPTSYFTPAAAIDIRGSHLRLWLNSILAAYMDTKDNGGLQFMITDGTNTGYWNMLGNDTYEGGWTLLVQDVQLPVDVGTKPDLSAITQLGFKYNFALSPKNFQNTWFDYFVHGSGYSVTGGTENDPLTWELLASGDADYANGYGVVQEINGVYFINGGIELSGAYFKDYGSTIVYVNNPIADNYYRLSLAGSGHFQLGDKVGGRGIRGCAFNCPSDYPVHVLFNNNEINDLALYCSTFRNVAEVEMPTALSGALRECISCSFEECSGVYVNTAQFQYCNFVNADNYGVVIESENHDVTDCNFINCIHSILLPNSGTYAFDNLQFVGADGIAKYDFENASPSGHIIIEAINTSNPQYYENTNGGTSEIINAVYVTANVEDVNGIPMQDAAVYVQRADNQITIMNKYTDENGQAQASYNYLEDVDVIIRVRKSSSGSTRYYPVNTTGTITSAGFNLNVVLQRDTVASA